jgi:hypothetical protein
VDVSNACDFSVLKNHQGRYAQAVAIDKTNVAIQAMFNAVIQANLIPNELSSLSTFFSELPDFLGIDDEFRFSNPEDISITFLD